MSRVQEIVELEERANASEAQASGLRWETARLISEELASGKTMRGLAAEISLSHVEVFRRKEAWKRYGNRNAGDRPTFAKACAEANDQGAKVGAATVTSTSTAGDTWAPSERSGTRQNNRYVGNGDGEHDEAQTPGGLAHELIEKASDCLDRLATHRSSWQFMTESDYQTLGNLPAVIRRIMADVDMAGVKLKGR